VRESEGEDKLVTFAPFYRGPGNVLELLGTICGPGESPYANGIFYVRISVPLRYSSIPPRFWFVTKIYRPNIDTMGTMYQFVRQKELGPRDGISESD
jgi:ubiquitin-conjugating enzyme E2 D/E